MIFVDSNVLMYLVGNPHPNRDRVEQTLARLAIEQERLVTGVEVYQEILHRYAAIGRPEQISRAFRRLDDIVVDVLTFGREEKGGDKRSEGDTAIRSGNLSQRRAARSGYAVGGDYADSQLR